MMHKHLSTICSRGDPISTPTIADSPDGALAKVSMAAYKQAPNRQPPGTLSLAVPSANSGGSNAITPTSTSPLKSPLRVPPRTPARSPSTTKFPPTPAIIKSFEEDLSRLEPDQMFARYTVSEVRALQTRLRTEADSKQEELRLMVGERYRDLLQASSAIVSISETSQRVRDTLVEMKAACSTSKEIRALQGGHKKAHSLLGVNTGRGRSSLQGKDVPLLDMDEANESADSQLSTLQSLAAHLKLLLDTPEQLWRLLERKRYLQAAWLYLLARVVHRALTDEDEDDEEREVAWTKEGIRVAALGLITNKDQFPLIQRQWDTISSFRSQISYRAGQSLRDHPSSPPVSPSSLESSPYLPVAETLVSILLLDSLPLSETLALFLSQRTKTLQAVYSSHRSLNSAAHSPAISKNRRKNQELAANLLRSPNTQGANLTPDPTNDLNANFRLPPSPGVVPDVDVLERRHVKRRREKILKHVRQSLKRAVDLIAVTLGASRDVYGGGKQQPLIEVLLENAASSDNATGDNVLENAVNTPLLLKSLPSSTLLDRYLPNSIKSFAPYIDTTSPSSRLSSSTAASTVSEWFRTSIESLEGKLSTWLEDLDSVRDVWSVWSGLQAPRSDTTAGWWAILTPIERDQLLAVVKSACIRRVKDVWKDKLGEVEATTVREVQHCVETLRGGGKDGESDVNPSSFYFQPEFLAALSGADFPAGPSSAPNPLQKCKDALKQRVSNRTPMLHSVLVSLELLAKDLKDDLLALESPAGSSATTVELMKDFRPDAQSAALEMAKSLRTLLQREGSKGLDAAMDTLVVVFVGKVALELATESPFVEDLVPGVEDHRQFRSEMSSVHDDSLERWRTHSVSKALGECGTLFSATQAFSITSLPSTPSPCLIQSLMNLAGSIQELGLANHALRSKQVSKMLLDAFTTAVSGKVPPDLQGVPVQALWDLSFLSKLASDPTTSEDDRPITQTIERVRSHIVTQITAKEAKQLDTHVASTVDLQQGRTQLLLGLLLGPSSLLAASSAASVASRNRSGTALGASTPPAEKDFQLAMAIAKPSSRFGMLLVGGVDGKV
ncbi:hypothetical protein FRB99_005867 [Tulasnella sp. 403]|nr:hypothetical protein FRB99_005867 [Tulasnella sp. 403]